jgi:hypothetical protein
MRGQMIGSVKLPASSDQMTEACLELLESSEPGSPVFKHLANIRINRRAGAGEQLVDNPDPSVDPVVFTSAVKAAVAASTKAGSKTKTVVKAKASSKNSSANNKQGVSKPGGRSSSRTTATKRQTNDSNSKAAAGRINGGAAAAIKRAGSKPTPSAALPKTASSGVAAAAAGPAGNFLGLHLPSSATSGLRTAAPGTQVSGSSSSSNAKSSSTSKSTSSTSSSSSAADDVIAVPKGPAIKPAPIALSAAAFQLPTVEHWAPKNDNALLAVPAPDPVLATPPPELNTHNAPVAMPAPKVESLLPQLGQNPIGNFFSALRSRYKW